MTGRWRSLLYERWELLTSLSLFLFLALSGLLSPGMHNDEGLHGLAAGYVLAPESAAGSRIVINQFLSCFGRLFPVMLESYDGAVLPYYLAPFLKVFGRELFALRLAMVLLSAGTLVCLYETCRSWFGRKTAGLTVLLTATNLFFIHYSRIGLHRNEVPALFFLWAGFCALTRGSSGSRTRRLCLAAFLLGLGLSMKITFLWYLAALAGAGFLFRRRILPLLAGWRVKACAGASFAAGLLPLLVYNLDRGGWTLRLLWESLASPTRADKGGVDNTRYLANLGTRIGQFGEILAGKLPVRGEWGVTERAVLEAFSPGMLALTLGAMAFVLLRAAAGRLPAEQRPRLLFLCAFYGLVFLQTPFTVSNLDTEHLLVLLPLPQVLLALAAVSAAGLGMGGRALGGALVLAAAVFHAGLQRDFDSQMRRNGGYRRWSTSIGELADYLKKHTISSPVIFGFAARENVVFLTGEAVRPALCRSGSEDEIRAAYRAAAAGGGPMHWVYTGAREEERGYLGFRALAREDGRAVRLERCFLNREGHPVYWLFKVLALEGRPGQFHKSVE